MEILAANGDSLGLAAAAAAAAGVAGGDGYHLP